MKLFQMHRKLLHKTFLFYSRSSFGRRPRKVDVANTIDDVPGFVELDSSSSTIGEQLVKKAPTCFIFVTRSPDNDSKVRNALVF